MTDYHAKTINLVANGLGGWRLWTADDADDPAVVAVPYILAAEHERLMAERDAEIARMRDARILVLPGGLTGVCVGSRFGGWLMRRHPDGQWVSVVKLQEVDPNPEARSSAGDVARAALGDDNG
jgi:hypothetical protein